jgi:GT2 family glycosyltransferase
MSLISVLTPVYNTDPEVLDATVRSVLEQSYPRWELCLVDDASTDARTRRALAAWEGRDARIRITRRTVNGGISLASNDALETARGDVVALLDHDDLLHPDALGALNHAFVTDPLADVVYTDEDKVTSTGEHVDVFRKPGWSPEYLNGCMYLGHLTAYRTSLVRAVGGFRPELAGSQDWDLALRATEAARGIVHIPRVLYHWRVLAGSVAADIEAKPYALDAGRRAVADHLSRRGLEADLEDAAFPGWVTVRRRLTARPRVTAIIPTAGSVMDEGDGPYRLVDRCLEGLLHRTSYDEVDAVVVVSSNAPEGMELELPAAFGSRVTALRLEDRFNYSSSINAGASRTSAELLLLLNDDTEIVDPDWLTRLVEVASDPEIGVVGAKLLYPDGAVQHGGVTHDLDGYPHHAHLGIPDGPGYFGDLQLAMNYLAVTGACQVVRRDVFEEAGGYDPEFPLNYNDIDFCLRVVACGYRVVQENAATLVHHESVSRQRGVHTSELALFQERWGHQTRRDPFRRTIARVHTHQ